MSLSELPPDLQALHRADKLRLIQLLADEVAREDAIGRDIVQRTVPIWSPHDAFHGAATLLRVLDEDEAEP